MFLHYWSSLKNPNQRLQVILTGTFAFHIVLLITIPFKLPNLQNLTPFLSPPTHLDISLIRTSEVSGASSDTTPHYKTRTICAYSKNIHDQNYMVRWQSYVESFGNQYYPARALKENIQGHLRLLVAIHKNGTIKDIQIRQSSGSRYLDEAAIQIVQKAAPFEPLPPEITQEVDVLEIIRTWQFNGSGRIITP